MGYLHLFYKDYKGLVGILDRKKQEIKMAAFNRIKNTAEGSKQVERDYESLYNMDNDFLFKTKLNLSNVAIEEANDIIIWLDKVLQRGATIGALGASAYQEIDTLKARVDNLLEKLKFCSGTISKNGEAAEYIKNIYKDVETNGAGYLLELSYVYAHCGADYASLNSIHDIMINIGGHNNAIANMVVDPSLQEHLNELKAVLSSKGKSSQTHADTVFLMTMDQYGNGKTELASNWVGFQIKNVKEWTVDLRPYSLGEIGIGNFFTGAEEEYLVNIAGALDSENYIQYLPASIKRETGKKRKTQKMFRDYWHSHSEEIIKNDDNKELLWSDIKNSTKILGIVDAIGQKQNASIVDKVHFYVVRSKLANKIVVYPVSEILLRILNKYINENQDLEGDSKYGDDTLNYEWYNVLNYELFPNSHKEENREEKIKELSQKRSNRAYPRVWNAILNTKIQIAINFSLYF